MNGNTYRIHGLEIADSLLLLTDVRWCEGAARLADLTLSGPWYQLAFAVDDVAQCIAYPAGPTRKSMWVRSDAGEVGVKVTPRRGDPGDWVLPAPYLREIFAEVAALPLPRHACATRVAGPGGPAGVRIRVCLDDPATGHHEALFEARHAFPQPSPDPCSDQRPDHQGGAQR